MPHTYATVDELKAFAVDNGVSAMGTANDPSLLAVLEAASRRVDAYCGRTPNGTGFGPRTGTNWYDGGDEADCVDLDDDLLSVTALTVYDQQGGTGTALTATTHYLLEPANASPKREVELTRNSPVYIPDDDRVVSVEGVWGYAQELRAVSATLGTVTLGTVTAVVSGAGVAVGATLRVDSEDLYVTATSGTALATSGGTVTVARGQNGTTAAVHAAGAAISVHDYPREVRSATLQVALRRWRSREAGLTGDFGGSGMPVFGQRDTEAGILYSTVGHLRLIGIG